MRRKLCPRYATRAGLIAIGFALALSGCCSLWAYRNEPLSGPPSSNGRATFTVNNSRGGKHKKVLVLLALSGGGSRAAYFAGASMFKLDGLGVLSKVDVISSVSGGSLTAAYYCLSRDPDATQAASEPEVIWDEHTFRSLMGHDYIFGYRGLIVGGYIRRPYNFPRTWFTAYTRTDAMADVFENGLYEPSSLSIASPTFADLNPARPFLILNAGNGTKDYGEQKFGTPFTFTEQSFKTICSNIYSYPLAYGVMASAAFPGVFNYMTLGDFRAPGSQSHPCPETPAQEPSAYLHLLDGGTVDNLALESVRRVIIKERDSYDYFVVILVDAYTLGGSDSTEPDARGFWGHLVDTDFLTTYDSLLTSNRDELLREFTTGDLATKDVSGASQPEGGIPSADKIIFWHLTFDNIKDDSLKKKLEEIPTDFSISDDARGSIDKAINQLITKDDRCLAEIQRVIATGQKPSSDGCSAENKNYRTKVEKIRSRELK